jgi:hypothetical protein
MAAASFSSLGSTHYNSMVLRTFANSIEFGIKKEPSKGETFVTTTEAQSLGDPQWTVYSNYSAVST